MYSGLAPKESIFKVMYFRMDVSKLRSVLRDHNQDHLLRFWDVLDNKEKMTLYADLVNLNVFKVMFSCKIAVLFPD